MATWKKVLVSGSNISELNNDAGYLISQGSNLVSSSTQILLGGVLTGSADSAGYSTGSITNVAIADTAAISYTKIDFTGSGITSGSIEGYVTTSSFDAYTSSINAWTSSVTTTSSFNAFTASYSVNSASFSSSIASLNNFTESLTTTFVTTSSFNAFTASYSVNSASFSSSIKDLYTGSTLLQSTASRLVAASASMATSIAALNTFSGSINTYTSSNNAFQTQVRTFTASINTYTGSMNTYTASINAFTGSVNTFTGSFSSSVSTRLTADEVKYNAYTSSFTTTTLSVLGNAQVTGALGVIGTASFANNVLIQGNLTVAGTASFVNVEELLVKDKFITLNSGSATLSDAGFIFQSSLSGTGPSLYLEATGTGTYGRMAMALSVSSSATTATPIAYVTTTEFGGVAPLAAPVFGDTTSGFGNMYIQSNTGDIYIYA